MNKIYKLLVFTSFAIVILACLFVCIFIYKNDLFITEKMKNKNCISFTVLLYDDRINETFDKQLNAYIFLYDRNTNLLKILCINSNVVFFSNNRKIESLKKSFNKDLKKDVNSAINNFNFNLASIIGNIAITDFYIGTNFRKLDIVMNMNKKNNSIILKNNLINNDNDIEFLNCFEIIDCILHLIPSKFINIINNYNFFDTNISESSFLLFFLRLLFLRPIVVFYEIPIKYSNNCKIVKIKLDNENFLKFLNNAYSRDYNFHINKNELFINVRNASKIPMAAKNVSQILRKNNFDVLDWGNFFKKYNKTLIKDYKGNLMHALKISEILKIGNIVVSYDDYVCYDVDIIIGNDYGDTINKKANFINRFRKVSKNIRVCSS